MQQEPSGEAAEKQQAFPEGRMALGPGLPSRLAPLARDRLNLCGGGHRAPRQGDEAGNETHHVLRAGPTMTTPRVMTAAAAIIRTPAGSPRITAPSATAMIGLIYE